LEEGLDVVKPRTAGIISMPLILACLSLFFISIMAMEKRAWP